MSPILRWTFGIGHFMPSTIPSAVLWEGDTASFWQPTALAGRFDALQSHWRPQSSAVDIALMQVEQP